MSTVAINMQVCQTLDLAFHFGRGNAIATACTWQHEVLKLLVVNHISYLMRGCRVQARFFVHI